MGHRTVETSLLVTFTAVLGAITSILIHPAATLASTFADLGK